MAKKTPARRATPIVPPIPTVEPTRPIGSRREISTLPKGRFKVRALALGYYDHIRRRIGDVFVLASARDFSDRWMEQVDASTPERITTGVEELRKQHDEIIAARRPASGMVPDENNPLGG